MSAPEARPDDDAPDWVDAATPPVPPEFAGHLRGSFPASSLRPDAEALLGAACDALGRALAEGSGRAGAFHLLAADGLVTYACEAALDREAPAELLGDLAREVAEAAGTDDRAAQDEPDPRDGG